MKEYAGSSVITEDISRIIANLGGINRQGKAAVVTGGAGFLGSWICETLIMMGARVLCMDNLSSGSMSNIDHLASSENFRFVKADVSEPFSVDGQVDYVFHLASRASPFEFDKFPLEILKANTMGLVNSLEIATQKKARFLFTSTSETYGDPMVVPTPETYYGNVNAIGIRGCYDEAKRCGEAYVTAYKREYGTDARIVRIFNTYGPRMRGDGIYGRAVPRFLDQAFNGKNITVFGDGMQTRSFCYVSDQVEGLMRYILCNLPSETVINIGNNHEITILELIKVIKELIPTASDITFSPLPQDDPLKRCPDITRARQVLGWSPKVNLKEGLTKMIQWQKEITPSIALKQHAHSVR